MFTLNEILGTEFPIIQGGMANVATGQFAADVANAGALGLIATGAWNGDRLREEIRTAKAHTDKPFGVNIMMMSPFVEDIAKIVIEEGVKVVTTGAGNPGKYIPAWKEAGIKVFPVVAFPALAQRLERYDVDGFIAEGLESGGHIGDMTTMALVPQVIDAVSKPVVAAGGIADGRGMTAAAAFGACGIQVGTCLLASEECPIHINYKNAVLKAKAADTIVTGRSSGAPVRVLKNKMAKKYLSMEKDNIPLAELEKLTNGSLRRAVLEGDVDGGSLMCGQIAGLVTELRPLRTIFEEMMADYDRVRKEVAK